MKKRGCFGAEGGIRTPTPYGATPSRWCVCQFRHFRTRNGEKKYQHVLRSSQRREVRAVSVTSTAPVSLGLASMERAVSHQEQVLPR